jgi:hypothetical protein
MQISESEILPYQLSTVFAKWFMEYMKMSIYVPVLFTRYYYGSVWL